jgi:hypothetical protein
MKTPKIVCLFAAVMLLASACTATRPGSSGVGNSSFGGRAITPEVRLALGTLKLEQTPMAVSRAAAAQLLPLWQLLAQLHKSSSTAPEEITAVLDAIRAAMSPEQIQAVDAMQVGPGDMAAVFQQSGPTASTTNGGAGSAPALGQSGRSSSGSRSSFGQRNFFFVGGEPGGAFGGQAGGAANGSRPSSGQVAPNGTSARSGQSFSAAASVILDQQVIRLLESRSAG